MITWINRLFLLGGGIELLQLSDIFVKLGPEHLWLKYSGCLLIVTLGFINTKQQHFQLHCLSAGPLPCHVYPLRRQWGWPSTNSKHLYEPAQAPRVPWWKDVEAETFVCHRVWSRIWAELSILTCYTRRSGRMVPCLNRTQSSKKCCALLIW